MYVRTRFWVCWRTPSGAWAPMTGPGGFLNQGDAQKALEHVLAESPKARGRYVRELRAAITAGQLKVRKKTETVTWEDVD